MFTSVQVDATPTVSPMLAALSRGKREHLTTARFGLMVEAMRCSGCKEDKPPWGYYSRGDGLMRQPCRRCRLKYQKAYDSEHRARKALGDSRRYWADPERRRKQARDARRIKAALKARGRTPRAGSG